MRSDALLAELRITNDLLRLLLAARTPDSPSYPYPAETDTKLTLFDVDDDRRQAPTGWHKADTGSRRWTAADRNRLRVLWEVGMTDEEIADKLGRSPDGIRTQRSRDGLVGRKVA